MPIKGLEKGDGVWGRGKEPFLKRFFPLPQVQRSASVQGQTLNEHLRYTLHALAGIGAAKYSYSVCVHFRQLSGEFSQCLHLADTAG